MRICDLTDEQLEASVQLAEERESLASQSILAELLDRRRAAKLDALAHSMAYEFATSLIEGMTAEVSDEAESSEPFFDLDDCAEHGYIEDEVDYLEQRGLLVHHPRNPRWVQFHNESEATA